MLPARASGQAIPANVRGLEEGELILAYGVPPLLRLRREGRNSSIRRVHNQRRPPTHMLVTKKNRRAVGAADVLLAPAIRAPLV